MMLPFALGTIPLPDWMPGWLPVVLLIPVVLWLILLVVMPFAVLGTRSRLEGIEAQLDDLHAELRNLGMQLGQPLTPPLLERPRDVQRLSAETRAAESRSAEARPRGTRAEPRIDWPRAVDD